MDTFINDYKTTVLSDEKTYFCQIRARVACALESTAGVQSSEIFKYLEKPKKVNCGDLILPVIKFSKDFAKLGEKLKEELLSNSHIKNYIQNVIVSGPFLNIYLDSGLAIQNILGNIDLLGDSYGNAPIGKNQTVIIDTSSPNIAKPFHVGHLRSTIIGNFLKNLYRKCGYSTKTLNYLGDWGKQYGLLAVGYMKYGDEEKLKIDPITHLFEIYVKVSSDAEKDTSINEKAKEYFVRMEKGGEEELKMWRKFKDMSLIAYKKIYEDFNISFDIWSGESHYEGKMEAHVGELQKLGLLSESQNALCIDLTKEKLGTVIVKKADGASIYFTRDIAASHDRILNMKADKLVYVVACQQEQYFEQLFTVLKKMDMKHANDCVHIGFGMIKGMKTRKGTVVFLEDVLNEAKEKILDEMKKNDIKYAQIEDPIKVSNILAVSAITVQDMLAKRIKDYTFHIDRVISFEGDTGPYLQYTHSRLSSIIRKSEGTEASKANLFLLTEDKIIETIMCLGRYPETIVEAFLSSEPCTIVGYLMKLCHLTSRCLETIWVAGQEKDLAMARLEFYKKVKTVLSNGIKLIGLTPLERM
eukprot:GHVP01022720.1.p1 GENE.GHVP01022720.1~~GHVP01022720.1.p1  ORF type:complete len:584 (-),score=110.92 GHVP01022720.1:812-2563(-)